MVRIICEPCGVTLACVSRVHVRGACAISKMGASKYSNGLTGTPADSNLGKLSASHFKVPITQNANENMPNMFPLVYLNENLRYCNENGAWGKQEPLIQPYSFWYSTKGEKAVKKLILLYFLVDIITFKSFQIIFSIEYQHTSPV